MASPAIGGDRRSAGDMEATIEENLRKEIARELHDRVAQTLTTMLVDLENFKLDQAGRQSVLNQVNVFQDSTRHVLDNLRQLLYDLRGEESVGESLVDAVTALAGRFQDKTRIVAQLSVHPGWPATLGASAAANLYRIIEEALSNVRNHSGARTVRISLEPYSDTELAVLVRDDGNGVQADEARPRMGMGMLGMHERALFLGGKLHIESQAGDGTTICAVFPKEGSVPIQAIALDSVPA